MASAEISVEVFQYMIHSFYGLAEVWAISFLDLVWSKEDVGRTDHF